MPMCNKNPTKDTETSNVFDHRIDVHQLIVIYMAVSWNEKFARRFYKSGGESRTPYRWILSLGWMFSSWSLISTLLGKIREHFLVHQALSVSSFATKWTTLSIKWCTCNIVNWTRFSRRRCSYYRVSSLWHCTVTPPYAHFIRRLNHSKMNWISPAQSWQYAHIYITLYALLWFYHDRQNIVCLQQYCVGLTGIS